MAQVLDSRSTFRLIPPSTPASSPRLPRVVGFAPTAPIVLPWRRLAKLSFGAALLAIGALTIYRQLVVEVSHDAIINARVTIIRAPIEGMVTASVNGPGTPIGAGAAIGQVEDPRPDDARLFELVRQADTTDQERGNLSRRLGDLQRAREQADAQAVLQACFAQRIRLRSFNQSEPNLHEVFMRLVGQQGKEAA